MIRSERDHDDDDDHHHHHTKTTTTQQKDKEEEVGEEPPGVVVWFTEASVLSACNFVLGFVLALPDVYMTFALTAHFTPAEMQVVSTALFFPWFLKPIFAACIDRLGIAPSRYVQAWVAVVCVVWVLIAWRNHGRTTIGLFILVSFALAFADVALDLIMVLRAKLEYNDGRELQARVLLWRSIGAAGGAGTGGFVYGNFGVAGLFSVVIGSNVVFLASSCLLDDVKTPSSSSSSPCSGSHSNMSFRDLVGVLFRDLRFRKAMLFTILVHVVPDVGSILDYYMITERRFTPQDIGVLELTSSIAVVLGALLYSYAVFGFQNRTIMRVGLIIMAIDCLWPIGFILRWNEPLRIPEGVWALLSSFLRAAVERMAIMPISGAAMVFCNDGLEATTYATFTAAANFASVVSNSLGASLAEIMGIKEGNMSLLWVGFLVKGICCFALSFTVGLLPLTASRTHADAEREEAIEKLAMALVLERNNNKEEEEDVPCA